MIFLLYPYIIFIALIKQSDTHEPIYWMHVPKTSSTFSLTIQCLCNENYFWNTVNKLNLKDEDFSIYKGCIHIKKLDTKNSSSEINKCNWNCYNLIHHRPLPQPSINKNHKPNKNFPPATTNKFITILREPKSRIISSFLDRHFQQLPISVLKKHLMADPKGRKSFYDRLYNNMTYTMNFFEEYAKLPHVKACQTKMLAGIDCYSSRMIDEKIYKIAVRNLHTLKFVGIFEKYNETLIQFHQFMSSSSNSGSSNSSSSRRRPPHPLEYKKFRQSRGVGTEKEKNYWLQLNEKLMSRSNENDLLDVWDEKIYQEALKLFEEKTWTGKKRKTKT